MRVLDVGSGSGALADAILRARPDAQVLGADLADGAVSLARARVPKAAFLQQDFARTTAIAPEYVGWATHAVCSEVLEHLDDPETVLGNVRPYLARGCRLVVTVPAGPMTAFDKHIGHRRHFTADSLARVLRSSGFDVERVVGAGFPFFNLYRLAVLARGDALIADVAEGDGAGLPARARLAMGIFAVLFSLNLDRSRLGWQLAATAVVT